jgi:hypothetical protein
VDYMQYNPATYADKSKRSVKAMKCAGSSSEACMRCAHGAETRHIPRKVFPISMSFDTWKTVATTMLNGRDS